MPTNIIAAAIITAYCACKVCCGPNAKGITANGQRPKEGITVAASRRLPFGTTVIIAGRVYAVEDRLAKRYDSRFDIYFSSHQKAKNFGIKTQQVKVIIK
jgi:3D (Asp-Asp-Asp) domain-containing protein